MSQKSVKLHAIVKANQQRHYIGKTIKTFIFGRMVEGKILAVHPFGTVDIEIANGNCYRVSGLSLS